MYRYRKALLSKREECQVTLGIGLQRLAEYEHGLGDDAVQITHDEFVGLRLNGLVYGELRQVEFALKRLEGGEYGHCVYCGGTIPSKRLQAVPWANSCVDCQEKVAPFQERELAGSARG
jgi:DnaK suppressor protein